MGDTWNKVSEIKDVYSHAQALSQCSKFIKSNNLTEHVRADTAGSAEMVSKSKDKTKAAILEDGLSACQQLMLDPDKIYQHTFTSYIPLKHNGIIYSDYKSASSIERIEAFMALGKKDPIEYADERGPVDWEVVTKHAQKIINAHQKNQLST